MAGAPRRANRRLRCGQIPLGTQRVVGCTMRRLSLNDWQLYGLVFSIAWALGAAAYAWQAWDYQWEKLGPIYADCVFKSRNVPSACDTRDQERRIKAAEHAGSVLFFCLILIPFAWLLAYVGEWGLRWLIRPFRPWE